MQRIDLGQCLGVQHFAPGTGDTGEAKPCATDPPLLEPTLATPVAVISLGVVRSNMGTQASPGEARVRLKDRPRLLTLLRVGLPAALGFRLPQEQPSTLPPAAVSLRLALLAPALVDLLVEDGDWV